MNKVHLDIKFISISIAAACAIAMLTILVIMASLNQPIADQYNFMANLRDQGILGFTAEMYTTWSGRLIQTLGLGATYRLFGDAGAQIAAPLILLTLLGAAFAWLIYQLFKFKQHRVAYSVSLGFLLAASTLYTTSCLFDIYLWLDAAFVHMLGLVAIVYDVALYLWTCQNFTKIKARASYKIILAILLVAAVFLQTASEASMAMTLGWSFLAFLATCIHHKWHKYRLPSAIIFAALLAGSLIMVLAPGLWVRAEYTSDSTSLVDLIINLPLVGLRRLAGSLTLWRVCLMVICGIAIGSLSPVTIKRRQLKYGCIAALLILLSSTYIPIFLYFYGSRAPGIETRALAVPCMGVMLSVVIFTALIYSFFTHKYRSRATFSVAICAILVICLGIFSAGFLKFSKGYLSVLVTRNNLISVRNHEIAKYQNGEISTLNIPDAPIMIENSGATDFSHNGWSNIEWFYDTFINYYQLDPADVTVHGEKLVAPESKQPWYVESGRNLCLSPTYLVPSKYYCEIDSD